MDFWLLGVGFRAPNPCVVQGSTLFCSSYGKHTLRSSLWFPPFAIHAFVQSPLQEKKLWLASNQNMTKLMECHSHDICLFVCLNIYDFVFLAGSFWSPALCGWPQGTLRQHFYSHQEMNSSNNWVRLEAESSPTWTSRWEPSPD